MTISSLIEKVTNTTKSAKEKQYDISVSEVWHLSKHLQMRYDVLETTNILKNFISSSDLQLILDHGVNVLQKQVKTLEDLMIKYQLPVVQRPPFDARILVNEEAMNDRYVFRRIFRGIQAFLPNHISAFDQSTDPIIREHFKKFLLEEIDLYDKFIEYGKLKGFEQVPPRYRS